ncbi:hypothetical protein WMY93_010707 [Mugilogobius chulae]|uniref:Uncharacterized protein n=1 Tax=Mugilogobius chulae TaxID=88201 RepID=A0AAW0PEF3_9GOBI
MALGWTFWTALLLLKIPISGPLVGCRDCGVLESLLCVLCLLCPVVESGRMLMSKDDRSYMGPHPDLTKVPLSTLASLLACLIWEKGLCDEKLPKENPKSKGLEGDTFIPLYQGKVIDMLKTSLVETDLYYAIAKLAFVSLGSAIFSGARGGLFMFSLARLNRRLKHLLFNTLLQQEIQFFDENNPGKLSSRLHSDVDRMGRTVALNANVLVRSTVKTCLMLVVMVQLSWELTVLTVLEMPLIGLVQNKYTKLSTELKEQVQAHHAEISELVLQSVSGIETVRSFNAEDVEIKRYNAAVEQLRRVKRQSGIYSSIFCFVRRMITLVIRIIFLVLARRLILSDQLSIGSLVTFLLYQKPMSYNLREIMYGYGETKSTVGVISKVFSYLDRKPKCQTAGDLAPEKLEGRIVFENVSFTYPSASAEKTAPTALKMAVVSQNPVLFCGSLKYNIEYGLKESNIDKVQDTAKRIKAESFFSDLDDGYDTDVGEAGGKLSEGLKQSIAILRALVRDPQVIILDEATSKLDVLAQHAVLGEILSGGRTVLVVAHQLKTVEKADHIIFLENGEIVEEGTHQNLMDKRGRYYSLKEELFKT